MNAFSYKNAIGYIEIGFVRNIFAFFRVMLKILHNYLLPMFGIEDIGQKCPVVKLNGLKRSPEVGNTYPLLIMRLSYPCIQICITYLLQWIK